MDKEKLRRKRISQTMKRLGLIPPSQKGKKLSEEHKQKIGLNRRGRKHSEETKIKCGLVNKGKILTEEHKRKISENNARYWQDKKREHMSGTKNWNYGKYGSQHTRFVQDKKTSLRKAVRQSKKYFDFKRKILERDKFHCVKCGKQKNYLELDHYPVSFAELFRKYSINSIEEALVCDGLWDVENGRTLCQPCHEMTDSFPQQLKGKRKILYGTEVRKVTK